MRTITLELLRHGPPHNQLLSPLTPYLALCENHAAVTVQLTFEHNQFLHRLRALSYQLGPEPRAFQLQDTAVALGVLLAGVPGLTAELSRQSQQGESHAHLRLIVSASELALLPFELALAPNGFPGAGRPLLLQNALPLSLTREVRRVQEEHLHWPKRPKILFIAASPQGAGAVPLESHLLAMRRAVDPWVKHYDEADDEARRRRVSEHITLLPRASITDIENACASGEFTHIHLLAHGIQWTDGYDLRYGLALHDPLDPEKGLDRVSGARLASAIRPIRRRDPRALTTPAVVTLASCNSGNVGSVAGAGASIAHSLHEAGIPLVIGSQFPLSFPGSVLMVEALYGGLLWGQDPRVLVSDLRRQLHSLYPDSHDWASIAAYASLSSSFEADLEGVQLNRVMAHINTAMNHADEATKQVIRFRRGQTAPGQTVAGSTTTDPERLLDPARKRMELARERLELLLKRDPKQRAQVFGLLASTEKRQAGVLFAASGGSNVEADSRDRDRGASRRLLERSRDHYWQTFRLDRAYSWAIVQYLSLDLVLRHMRGVAPVPNPPAVAVPGERDHAVLWRLAEILSKQDLSVNETQKVESALGNLIELNVLALFPELHHLPDAHQGDAGETARKYARELVAKAGPDSFVVYSVRRQMLRYMDWYGEISDLGGVVDLAKTLSDVLPETVRDDWD
jgi:hypothetical protein